MAWIKRTSPVEPAAPEEETPAAETLQQPEEPEQQPEEQKKSAARYFKSGRRRGARRGMALLGLIVLIFALIGVIATVVTGIRIIRSARDTSYLKEEMYYTLLPLTTYAPDAFENVNDTRQDALMLAALYRITNRETIRHLQDPSYVSPYPTDEFGRTAIPKAEVAASYAALFGPEAVPDYHTFGGDTGFHFTYEYDEAAGIYYVPYTESPSTYETAVDTIQRAGNTYTVRVGFVHRRDVTVDDHGNQVVDLNKATYFQIYTLEKLEDGSFVIRSVADESEHPTAAPN